MMETNKRLAFEQMRRKKDIGSRNTYARLKNQLKWQVRKAVKLYEKKIAEDRKKDKAFYKYANHANSKLKCRETVPDLDMNGRKVTNNHDRVDVFNKFFSSVFTEEETANIPEPVVKFPGQKLVEFDITEEIVREKLDNLNQNKSP